MYKIYFHDWLSDDIKCMKLKMGPNKTHFHFITVWRWGQNFSFLPSYLDKSEHS